MKSHKKSHKKRRHRRTLKGGRFIGKGTYGCVFIPSLKCRSSTEISDPSKISKILFDNTSPHSNIITIQQILNNFAHLDIFIHFDDFCEFDPNIQSHNDKNDFIQQCSPHLFKKHHKTFFITQENGGKNLETILFNPPRSHHEVNPLINEVLNVFRIFNFISNPTIIFSPFISYTTGGGKTFTETSLTHRIPTTTKTIPKSTIYPTTDDKPTAAQPSRKPPVYTQSKPILSRDTRKPIIASKPTLSMIKEPIIETPPHPHNPFIISPEDKPHSIQLFFHGDIKPANIVIKKTTDHAHTPIFKLKFIDFDFITYMHFNLHSPEKSIICGKFNDFKPSSNFISYLDSYITQSQSTKIFDYFIYNQFLTIIFHPKIKQHFITNPSTSFDFNTAEIAVRKSTFIENLHQKLIIKFNLSPIFQKYIHMFIHQLSEYINSTHPAYELFQEFNIAYLSIPKHKPTTTTQQISLKIKFYIDILLNNFNDDPKLEYIYITNDSPIAQFINFLLQPFIQTPTHFTPDQSMQFIAFQRLAKIIYSSEYTAILNIVFSIFTLKYPHILLDHTIDIPPDSLDYTVINKLIQSFSLHKPFIRPTQILNELTPPDTSTY